MLDDKLELGRSDDQEIRTLGAPCDQHGLRLADKHLLGRVPALQAILGAIKEETHSLKIGSGRMDPGCR